MTLPIGSVDPDNLPQGVIKHDELGSALQDQSAAKFKSEAASRFPSMVNGTSAGNPANVGGPLGYVVNLSSNFTSNVANADPATIKKPDDLLPLANPFFNGLPLMDVLERIPIIGDIIEVITGVEDGDVNDIGTWINQLKTLLTGGTVNNPLPTLVGIALGTVQRMVQQIADIFNGFIVTPINAAIQGVKDWFSNLLGWQSTTTTNVSAVEAKSQGILDAAFNGYHGTSSVGANLNDLSVTMASVDNRLTSLEGGGVRYSITSSTTVDLSGKAKVKGVLIGSSSAASAGGNQAGGAPGTPGGYVELPEIDVAWLATQVPDITAVSVVVGTSGGESKFGQRSDGTWVFETRIGFAVKIDGYSFVPCNSGPGIGGWGGAGYGGGTSSAGAKGGDSMLAIGGAGGAYGGNGPGGAGGNGIQAPIDGPAKSGGSGGGGGGGGGVTYLGGIGQSGGAGGHGAFPGGAPGGGGGRASNPGGGTTVGAGGSSANGYVELEAV